MLTARSKARPFDRKINGPANCQTSKKGVFSGERVEARMGYDCRPF
jgi:hypothetical protein